MSISRRKFLKLSLISSGFVIRPKVNFYEKLTSGRNVVNIDKEKAFTLSKLAKAKFYLKQNEEAKKLYLEAVSLDPSEIAYYDGLQNVYGSENKYLQIIELYNNGLKNNSEHVVFYDRLAHSMVRLSLGNSKQEYDYVKSNNNIFLMEEACKLYFKAINKKPTLKYLREGVLHITKKLKIKNHHTAYGRKEKPILSYETIDETDKCLKTFKSSYKKTELLSKLDINTINKRIKHIDKQKRRIIEVKKEQEIQSKNIIKYKKSLYNELIKKASLKKDTKNVISISKLILTLDKNDTNSIHQLLKSYRSHKNYSAVIDLYRELINSNKSIWHQIGLAKALKDNYVYGEKKEKDITEAISIYDELLQKRINTDVNYLITDGMAKAYISIKEYIKAQKLYIDAIKKLNPDKQHLLNTMFLGLSQIYSTQKKYDQAEKILLFVMDESKMTGMSEIDHLCDVLKARKKNKPITNLTVYHSLAKLYRLNNNSRKSSNDIYRKILSIQPNDNYAKKMVK